ncbi:M23 family metallopeptidase [Lysobacter enzymogenes]|uniref:M23 family metallopeptidase n=1 Tax=Lysobacter enzymogenes TaxID=69 RepID=UPI001A975419|nr:M23 family metallopeptidase [Lysobacter enzymogenes]QQP98680.1 peptidoglycan DD-metalloendopeptidase family protein [Lysobacter enzymogenes]
MPTSRIHTPPRRRAPRTAALLAVLGLGLCASAAHAARPNFQMPFACNQTWYGDTYPGHGLRYAVDLNHKPRPLSDADLGSPVVASAAGKATTYNPHPGTGYGKLVVIDHGGGWTTWYAHLDSIAVGNGANVSQGQKIGTLGKTTRPGNSISAHLHYEQRLNGDDQKIVWNGSTIVYDQYEVAYKSRNSCGTAPGGVAGTVRTAGSPLNVRSGPGTTYSVVGSLANGAAVTIRCQKTGETITGTYGTSNIWNNVGAAGTNKYIPDAYTFTGSDGRVAPDC